jgi:hypothetical protein
MNLVTPKVGAKHELLSNNPALGVYLGPEHLTQALHPNIRQASEGLLESITYTCLSSSQVTKEKRFTTLTIGICTIKHYGFVIYGI